VSPLAGGRVALAIARRPSLWIRPFLPVPSAEYLKFRLVTQYGDPGHRIEAEDVLNYLAWCRRHERAA
jgi:hypothetical protein